MPYSVTARWWKGGKWTIREWKVLARSLESDKTPTAQRQTHTKELLPAVPSWKYSIPPSCSTYCFPAPRVTVMPSAQIARQFMLV